ncbi:uncharacterized protein LOC118430152 [Branchiostoma floridae]|uniref:Uncharacterized protein LOC118430152 n=1 Tax=Branchiostoma floridae TaxID=7739 RepID=A0A9J7NBE6_BRAFL|nr:uncharacterized protein LOC118430152 [Branchiostoma floridae]
MNQLTWVVVLAISMTKLWITAQGIYVDNGNPYDKGTLQVLNFTISQHDAPLLTKVYYPKKIDTYAVLFFTGGLLGYIPAESYSDVLTRVASHGFVVIGVDYLPFPIPTPPVGVIGDRAHRQGVGSHQSKKYMEELQWLTQNLEGRIAQQLNHTTLPRLVPAFDHLAVSCHSAGCDPFADMIVQNHTFAAAALFLEPFSFHFKTPLTFNMPALILGTEFSTEHPACIWPNEGYDHFYDMWKCPKIVMNVKVSMHITVNTFKMTHSTAIIQTDDANSFFGQYFFLSFESPQGHGHCEMLDAGMYSVCAKEQFCKSNPDADLNKYHSFVQGISVAFLTTELQGQNKLQYVTNTTLLPVELLEFKKVLDC